MKQSHRIAKNLSMGVVSAVVGGVLNFFCIFIVARFVNVGEFGIYNYLMAFAIVFQFMADFGLSNILVREIARNPHDLKKILGASRLLVWALFALVVLVMMIALAVFPMEPRTKALSFVMGFGYLALIHTVSYIAVLRATEEMGYNYIGIVFSKVILSIFLVAALVQGWGLWGVVWCHFTVNMMLCIYYHWIVSVRHPGGKMHYDLPLWRFIVIETLPMGAGMALRQFAWQLDIFLLTYLTNPTDVGLFSGPFRIVLGLSLLPTVVSVPLFPMFVRLARDSREQLAVAYQRAVKWFCMMSFPVVAACVAAPSAWIHFFLGDKYLASIPVLQVLGVVVLPVFVGVLYPFLYSALGIQKWFLTTMSLCMVTRICVGFFVIPHFGYLGLAVVIDAVEMITFLTLAVHLGRVGLPAKLATNLIKPLLAGVAMGAVLWAFANSNFIWTAFVTGIGCVVYFAMLIFLRAFSPEEMVIIRDSTRFLSGAIAKRAAS